MCPSSCPFMYVGGYPPTIHTKAHVHKSSRIGLPLTNPFPLAFAFPVPIPARSPPFVGGIYVKNKTEQVYTFRLSTSPLSLRLRARVREERRKKKKKNPVPFGRKEGKRKPFDPERRSLIRGMKESDRNKKSSRETLQKNASLVNEEGKENLANG